MRRTVKEKTLKLLQLTLQDMKALEILKKIGDALPRRNKRTANTSWDVLVSMLWIQPSAFSVFPFLFS